MSIKKSGNWDKRRKVRKIPEGKNVCLFYCGLCTEPDYFSSVLSVIKEKKEKESKGITKFNFVGKSLPVDPKKMVEAIVKYVGSSTLSFDEIFVVFDKDSFENENFDNAIKAVEQLDKECADTHFVALWSNQCLELWFILHFEYLQSQLERHDYFSKLKKHFKLKGKYQKNMKNYFGIISKNGGDISFAIENAHKLLIMHQDKTSYSEKYPATNVVALFDEYRKYLC